ncbi:MAG: hypothetical protein M0D57_16620 [Sphingobacteriales bacterium JAD_PAG50586_3]|nr:MAG: hypothetical protein M0D57_16620 [Sphingobacteriales bacterium JAD_PAG50586_3]
MFYKKLLISSVCAISVLLCGTVKAQDRSYELKNSLLSFGAGFGWVSSFYPSSSQYPTVSVSYEKGLLGFKRVGLLSLGLTGGYHHAYYDYSASSNYAKWDNVVGALRVALHPTFLLGDNFNCYIGMLAGGRYEFFKDTYYDQSPSQFEGDPYKRFGGFRTLFAGFVGMRWYPGEKLGFFVEGGYGMNYVTIGINWKFGERNIKADPDIIKRGTYGGRR